MARPAKFADVEVLDRATDLFWRDGCDAVSIRDLEVALELRAPSIYRRFESKDRLIAACVDRYVDRIVEGRVRRHLDGAVDPLAGLRTFFTSVLDVAPGEARPRGCLLTVTAGQHVYDAPEVHAAVTNGFDRIEVAFRTQLERARTSGQVATEVDIAATARYLLVAFQGLLLLARAGAPGLPETIDAVLVSITERV